MNFMPKILPVSSVDRRAKFERALIRREAKIGGKLFGPLPKGHHRQFFCLDEHTWIWHEEWIEKGQRRVIATRYEVRPNGILKFQDGQATQFVSPAEARNLYKAAELYYRGISAEYQRMLQQAA